MMVPVKDKTILIDFLLEKLGTASRTKVRKLIKHGGVILGGKTLTMPDQNLFPGQIIEIRRPAKPPTFPILYEDPHLIAAEKPPGLLSIGTGKEGTETFYKAVNQYLQLRSNHRERAFIVHRLDRDVSGVMLFAKTVETKEALQKNWHETEKLYSALVEGHPREKEGTIRGWLKDSFTYKVFSNLKDPHSKFAVTHYRQVKEYPRHALLEIRPETGRKNQIRVHLSEIGCPIVGDKKYGAAGNPIHRIALHATALSFIHPVSGLRIKLESPVPRIFIEFGKKRGKAKK